MAGRNYDLFPKFPALQDFSLLAGKTRWPPLLSVIVAHSRLITSRVARHRRRIPFLPGAIETAWAQARDPAAKCFGTARGSSENRR